VGRHRGLIRADGAAICRPTAGCSPVRSGKVMFFGALRTRSCSARTLNSRRSPAGDGIVALATARRIRHGAVERYRWSLASRVCLRSRRRRVVCVHACVRRLVTEDGTDRVRHVFYTYPMNSFRWPRHVPLTTRSAPPWPCSTSRRSLRPAVRILSRHMKTPRTIRSATADVGRSLTYGRLRPYTEPLD
jgi:hypothetical protein